MRPQAISYKLLRYYMEYCNGIANAFAIKCFGAGEEAKKAYYKFLEDFGKYEKEIETYYDQYMMGYCFAQSMNKMENNLVENETSFAAQ